jgi:hypothetical protein
LLGVFRTSTKTKIQVPFARSAATGTVQVIAGSQLIESLKIARTKLSTNSMPLFEPLTEI